MHLTTALQIIQNGVITGLLYSLAALGFHLIYSSTNIFHVAHGATYTATPYILLAWTTALTYFMQTAGLHMVLPLAVVFTLISVSALSLLSEIVVFRPLYLAKVSPTVTFISSLGLYIALVNLIALLSGHETKVLNPYPNPSLAFGGVLITRIQLIQFLVSLVTIGLAFLIIRKTSLGRNIRALADNATLVSVLGIDVKKIRAWVFVLGGSLVGVAALLKAFDIGADLQSGLPIVLVAAVAVIIGGVKSLAGSVLGALLLGLTHNAATWFLSAEWQNALTFIFFVTVLIARGGGILTTPLRLEER
jgi:branched-chain amino acid transport system permease protein